MCEVRALLLRASAPGASECHLYLSAYKPSLGTSLPGSPICPPCVTARTQIRRPYFFQVSSTRRGGGVLYRVQYRRRGRPRRAQLVGAKTPLPPSAYHTPPCPALGSAPCAQKRFPLYSSPSLSLPPALSALSPLRSLSRCHSRSSPSAPLSLPCTPQFGTSQLAPPRARRLDVRS